MPLPSFIRTLGSIASPVVCTPGADLWVTPGTGSTFTLWLYAGQCATDGTAHCGTAPTQYYGWGIYQYLADVMGQDASTALCFEDTRLLGPAAPGTGASSPVYGGGFEFTPEQQTEVYSAMVVVFGAFLGALALAWGFKAITRVFNWHGNNED